MNPEDKKLNAIVPPKVNAGNVPVIPLALARTCSGPAPLIVGLPAEMVNRFAVAVVIKAN